METKYSWTRVNNDINGNPRYVVHFLNILNQDEMGPGSYEAAIKRANKIGGRKFHNKQYGGGLVFQSYNIYETEKYLEKAKGDRL